MRNVARVAFFLGIVVLGLFVTNTIKWLNTDDNNPVMYTDVTKVRLRETEAIAALGKAYDPSKTTKTVYDIKVKWKRGMFPFLRKELDTVRVAHIQVK